MDKLTRSQVQESENKKLIKYQVQDKGKSKDKLIRHQVMGIGGGSDIELKTLTISSSRTHFDYEVLSPDYAWNRVVGDVTPILSVATFTENGTYLPSEPPYNAYGFGEITVNVQSLPNEYIESQFDLLHSNSVDGFIDSIKKIALATNKYNQFGNGFINGRNGRVMMGYTNQGDIKRCVIKMGTFDRTVETQDQYQTLFKLITGNNHYTIRWDNTNNRWHISDASGSPIYISGDDLPKYSFDGANVEIVFGAKYINGELYRGIKENNVITSNFQNQIRVYINGTLAIETGETFTGDTTNYICEWQIGGGNSWVGASFEECKIYTVLNCYDKYYESVGE